MKLKIVGNGAFGSFLKELLAPHFELSDDAHSIILAVPISAYADVSRDHHHKHLINVCSVQKPSTDICLQYSDQVTSIHPLFGRRTPSDKRNSMLTYTSIKDNDTWLSDIHNPEYEFCKIFSNVSTIQSSMKDNGVVRIITPESHDRLMAKTHVAAVMAAKQLQVYIDRSKDVPDEFVPHSFRMMREFVKTLDDMPKGTIESIMANPYF